MENKKLIRETAIGTVITEASSIQNLVKFIDESFVESVESIFKCKGRVIITGIGKSAIIAQKIVATFNSTGTPSIFMHAADAIHGDLGIVQKNDLVILISKSGDSPEIKVLIPLIKNLGNKTIGIVSNLESYLATYVDIVVKATVEKEACPNNIVPTSSTTAQLVIGDAIAVCLLRLRGFALKDFAKFHPGGTIGKKLYLRVKDLCSEKNLPKVFASESIKNVIVEISSKRLGATAVLDEKNTLIGIITDGDLRRMLQHNENIQGLKAMNIMTINPKTISANALAADAFILMENNNITQLIVVDNNKYVGMIHIHDILKEGII
ncbi:MAG TPA: D-arabinose 5-phosphate isomerase [Bacteroidales bacterium]|nr:MAG: D-arabinose 5-phosphate isomerase [Bacteroidetes bacterium GWF2_33_38]OFY89222.1 MAG: D-arabinose 5-phosphate isomerase [Bacteroidetes bacterium RIFOXYA2_FULL_33_7]HBF89130.1 D-arabinose 5-phosphate isomerase [Bacteroidales bacterium]